MSQTNSNRLKPPLAIAPNMRPGVHVKGWWFTAWPSSLVGAPIAWEILAPDGRMWSGVDIQGEPGTTDAQCVAELLYFLTVFTHSLVSDEGSPDADLFSKGLGDALLADHIHCDTLSILCNQVDPLPSDDDED